MAKGQGVVKFVSIAKIACSPGEVLRHHASELTQTDDDVHNEDLIEQLSRGKPHQGCKWIIDPGHCMAATQRSSY